MLYERDYQAAMSVENQNRIQKYLAGSDTRKVVDVGLFAELKLTDKLYRELNKPVRCINAIRLLSISWSCRYNASGITVRVSRSKNVLKDLAITESQNEPFVVETSCLNLLIFCIRVGHKNVVVWLFELRKELQKYDRATLGWWDLIIIDVTKDEKFYSSKCQTSDSAKFKPLLKLLRRESWIYCRLYPPYYRPLLDFCHTHVDW